jgi:acetylornithine deacetylase/succinyl-diaminopimelate desuccinylase-like protein
MTILPHRAAAKLDLRLVPDMTHKGSVEKLKAHLAKRGFGDIEVNVTGGYDGAIRSYVDYLYALA